MRYLAPVLILVLGPTVAFLALAGAVFLTFAAVEAVARGGW